MIWEGDLPFTKVVSLPNGRAALLIGGVVVEIACQDDEAAHKIARGLRSMKREDIAAGEA